MEHGGTNASTESDSTNHDLTRIQIPPHGHRHSHGVSPLFPFSPARRLRAPGRFAVGLRAIGIGESAGAVPAYTSVT